MTPTEMLRAHTRDLNRAYADLEDAQEELEAAKAQLEETRRRVAETQKPCAVCGAERLVWCDRWSFPEHERQPAPSSPHTCEQENVSETKQR